MGCDITVNADSSRLVKFQFTQPGWAATISEELHRSTSKFQFTQPGWAATDKFAGNWDELDVSIHAARMGCDSAISLICSGDSCFNSRSPDGLRPLYITSATCKVQVSIHAARMGCDLEAL
ncbi:Uncharacterised protein [Porphyromonas cangingivalis]|nr:Uncharacterised protein [Porphyromonas cangingivalis]